METFVLFERISHFTNITFIKFENEENDDKHILPRIRDYDIIFFKIIGELNYPWINNLRIINSTFFFCISKREKNFHSEK